MKVSYRGRVRKINVVPTTIAEFKRVVQQKFLNCHLMSPDEEQSFAMSRVINESEITGDNHQFKQMINDSMVPPEEESKIEKGKRGKREKNTVDFAESVVFYEDSEGDLNVISEDEDLQDATTYVL